MKIDLDLEDGGASWRDRKERMVDAWLQLKANPLFQRFTEDCLVQATACRKQAGLVATDRDANKLLGEANAFEAVVHLPRQIAEVLISEYQRQELLEKVEDGKTHSNGASVPGQEHSGDADSKADKYKRRRLVAK